MELVHKKATKMILSFEQIKEVILQPDKNQLKLIADGVKYSKEMRRHINGHDIDGIITLIDGKELKKEYDIRKKVTKSNKDISARLSRPIDKVWSAKGGSVYYNLSEAEEKMAIMLSNNISNGYSIQKWLEMFWLPHMLDDPFGIMLMEMLPENEAIKAKQENRAFIYPTYKSINTIYNYKPKGNLFDYIVFTVDDAEKLANGIDKDLKVFRIIDDAFDYLVSVKDQSVNILNGGLSIPNWFGMVPAIRNSDLISPENENAAISFFDPIIELYNNFFLKESIKSIVELRHGFPKYAEFADDCPHCKATGKRGGEDCKLCAGTGKVVMTNVNQVKALSWPTKDDVAVMPSNAGGYIEPSETFHKIATTGLIDLENQMITTIWGKQGNVKTQGTSINQQGKTETATEVMSDIKPEADRLHIISAMAEKRHKFILDFVVKLQLSKSSFTGASVNYGRRYMLEGPDAIWDKYSKARKDGAPQNVLDDLLNEFFEAKFMTDPVGLAVAKKLMYVEPFVHITAQQVKGLDVDETDYKMKLYFSDWLSLKTDAEIASMKVDVLKNDLKTFAQQKQLSKPAGALPATV